jgi:hypothetical protein
VTLENEDMVGVCWFSGFSFKEEEVPSEK